MADSQDTRFARNIAAFQARHPDVAARLASLDRLATRAVLEDGTTVNVEVGHGTLYPSAAAAWTTAQVEDYAEAPDRLIYADLDHCNLSPISLHLLDDMRGFLQEREWAEAVGGVPVADVGYLFVFGIGLGHHLEALLGQTPVMHVVLIEPEIELLRHSLDAIDWEALFAAADGLGTALHFVLAGDPAAIVGDIEEVLLAGGNTFLDGSLFYRHYAHWTLAEAETQLRERLRHFSYSMGFFEDELEMIKNAYENLRRWPFLLVESKPYLEMDFPVFVVGSGPSLDGDIENIAKWRDHAIIFSAGTGLRALLKNGIRPDFHCEVERVPLVAEILAECHDEFGLDGITLMASTTADPAISAYFDEVWYYFRGELSPASLIDIGANPMSGMGPLVANAAFAGATSLGFRNVYLFGTDFSLTEGAPHHSKDSIYYQEKYLHQDEEFRASPGHMVAGNFGGTVKTLWAYDLGIRLIGEVQALRQTTLFNCSRGARIPGAQPKVSAAIDLSDVEAGHARARQRLRNQLRPFAAGEALGTGSLDAHIDGCDHAAARFPELAAAIKNGDKSFQAAEKQLERFLAVHKVPCRAFFALALPSMRSMLRLAAYFGCRMTDDEKRAQYLDTFADAYARRCQEMAETARTLLGAIRDGTVDMDHDYAAEPPELAAQG